MAIAIPSSLSDLVCYLESLQERASIEDLGRLLNQLDVTIDDLKPYSIFGEECYRRNLIKEGEWFELLCICWKSGQRSPIHNHAGSTCGLRIMKGVATETIFEETPSGQIKAVSSTDCGTGHVCCTQDEDVHQVSNLQAPGEDLMTLHIYSPALKAMDRFSLFSEERQIYVPKNNETICHVADCI